MNIAVIDDLQADRNQIFAYLRTFFDTHDPYISPHICGFESGESFLTVFKPNLFDFVFIDYYMKELSGLETAKYIRARDETIAIIFTTTSRDYAIDGYKVRASGYLLKPFSYEEFEETMLLIYTQKCRSRQFVEITSGQQTFRIFLNSIIYCDTCGHYAQVHADTELYKIRISFCELKHLLTPYKEFLFCYRGCVINMTRVKKTDELTFHMDNGERIPIRKKERTKLIQKYTDFLFEKVRSEA